MGSVSEFFGQERHAYLHEKATRLRLTPFFMISLQPGDIKRSGRRRHYFHDLDHGLAVAQEFGRGLDDRCRFDRRDP
jgi:hypothetical protein